MSGPEKKPGSPASETEAPIEPPAEKPKDGAENSSALPSSKGEYELGKKDHEQSRKGYQQKEHEEKEAQKQNLPKDKSGKPIEKKGIEVSSGPAFKFKTESETIYGHTNKEDANDKTYWARFRTKTSDVEAVELAVNVAEGKAKATLVKAEGEAQFWHGQLDIGAFLNDLFGITVPSTAVPAPPSFAPMAARVGDITTHGAPLAPGTGSPNVLIGGLPAWRVGLDFHACTAPGAGPHGTGPTAIGSLTVMINGVPAARMGDWVTEPNGGPNVIVKGCETVLVGAAAGAPPAAPGASGKTPADPPFIMFEGVAEANVLHAEAKANAYVDGDLKQAKATFKAEVDAEAAVAKVKVPLGVKIDLPFTEKFLSLGVTGEASVLSVGAGGGAKYDKGKAEMGGKIGLGLFGGGAKLSVGLVD